MFHNITSWNFKVGALHELNFMLNIQRFKMLRSTPGSCYRARFQTHGRWHNLHGNDTYLFAWLNSVMIWQAHGQALNVLILCKYRIIIELYLLSILSLMKTIYCIKCSFSYMNVLKHICKLYVPSNRLK